MLRVGITIITLLLLAAVRPAIAGNDLIWGANGHPFTAYPNIGYEEQLDYIRDLGMTSYRVNISRTDTAPSLKKLLEAAKSRGITILPVLTPAVDLDNDTPEKLYEEARAFAVRLVSQFKDDIRVWELGNEMENYAIIKPCEMQDDGVQYNCAWGPAGGVGPLEYYGPRWAKVSAVLKGLSDGTKSVDPSIRKAIGTAGWGHIGAFERLRQDGIEWDISVWHMYGEDPEWAFQKIAIFGKPIWVTEFNHPGGSEKSELEQAKGLQRWMTRLRELQSAYHVEAAHIYELLDEPYWAPSFEAAMGLVRLTKADNGGWTLGETKPAYCAAKQFIRTDLPKVARQCDLCLFDRQDASDQNKAAYSHCLILGRAPDGSDLERWASSVRSGTGIRDILSAMLGSEEFEKTMRANAISHEDYVSFAYHLLLGRDPDGGGKADYIAQLDQKTLSRAALLQALMQSDEFRQKHRILFLQSGEKLNSEKTTH